MTSLNQMYIIIRYLVVLPLTSIGNRHRQIGKCPATVTVHMQPHFDMQPCTKFNDVNYEIIVLLGIAVQESSGIKHHYQDIPITGSL